jgi:CRISPR-associated endonuclease/helicase Cas3
LDDTKKIENSPEVLLIHSRFRPVERTKLNTLLKESPKNASFPNEGRIIVSTQVVEAGVDLSSKTLISELSPWASMVQRFGRLNRYGEWSRAKGVWVDIDTQVRNADTLALPYTVDELENSRKILCTLQGASPREIDALDTKLSFTHNYVIRKKDFLDLWDTTPDLSGNDVDVSRYIRDSRDTDVSIYWRDWDIKHDSGRPPVDLPRAVRDELCSVSLYSFRDFQKKHNVWVWDHLNEGWVKPSQGQIIPGQVFLIHSSSGGYDMEMGWLPSSKKTVIPVTLDTASLNEATGVDPYTSLKSWITLNQHSIDTVQELEDLIQCLGSLGSEDLDKAIIEALLYHDIGKAHPVFQEAVLETIKDKQEKESRKNSVWGKSGGELRLRYSRRYFRHELASALMLLQNRNIIKTVEYLRDLVIYLVAAHHGKVRLSIRSLPGEDLPWEKGEIFSEGVPFARGVWEGDIVPKVELSQGRIVPETSLKLDYMGLGLTLDGEQSWAERMINLRDMPKLGPLRLGYLEAITRVSDWRSSMKEAQGEY